MAGKSSALATGLLAVALLALALSSNAADPKGMFITCYSAPQCFGYPWVNYFFNESDFNTNPFHFYHMLPQGATANSSSAPDLAGTCSTSTFVVPDLDTYTNGTYATTGCQVDPSDLEASCWASCAPPPHQTVGHVSIQLFATPARRDASASFQKRSAFASLGATQGEILDYLNSVNQFLNIPEVEAHYTFKNIPDVCQPLTNDTGSWAYVPSIGSPFFVKSSAVCAANSATPISFTVYSDAECTNSVAEVSSATSNGVGFRVANPLAIVVGGDGWSSALMSCWEPPAVIPTPTPAPAPGPTQAPTPGQGPVATPKAPSAATPSAASTVALSAAVALLVVLSILL